MYIIEIEFIKIKTGIIQNVKTTSNIAVTKSIFLNLINLNKFCLVNITYTRKGKITLNCDIKIRVFSSFTKFPIENERNILINIIIKTVIFAFFIFIT